MLDKKRLSVILKIVVVTAIGSMFFLFLCKQFGTKERYAWILIACAGVLLTCLELFLYEVGYYDNNASAIFQIIEYILSIGVIVFIVESDVKCIGGILILLAVVVSFIDALNWRKQTEPAIEKQIVIEEYPNRFKKCVTSDAIKMSGKGYLYFRDNQKGKVYISQDSIKCITFNYPAKLRLNIKLRKLIVQGNVLEKMSQEWYVKAILNDWLWISYGEEGITKNIIYPKKNVSWQAISAKGYHLNWSKSR